MGVINIRALFDWKDVQTGLERVKGQAQRTAAELDKSFSLASLGRNFLSAFAGLKLVEILVNPLKESLAYLQRMTSASQTLADQMQRNRMQLNTPERNLGVLQQEIRDRQGRLARATARRDDLPDFANSAYAQSVAKLSETMGLSGVPGSAAFQKGQYDQLTEEITGLLGELNDLETEFKSLTRNVETTSRQLGNERSGIYDERRVARGEMSQVEALQAAADRAAQEYQTVLRTRGRGAEADNAFNNMLRAQNALIPAEAEAERFRLQGVLPQISSSSLAQLGGGGNVNVFGGRPGEGITELREQTRLLRSIDGKVGGPRVTLDVGN